MKVFYINIESFGNMDFIEALSQFRNHGAKTDIYLYSFVNHGERDDPLKEEDMIREIRKVSPDFAFSFNYYPIVSKVCQKVGIKYISWVYDNPHIALFSYTLINSCNEVFLFDSKMYEDFASQGIKTVHYLPLAASVKRLRDINVTEEIKDRYSSQISFVGSLYTEEHNLYDRMAEKLDKYTLGYLDGLMYSQMQIQGYNFIENNLSKDIISSMYKALPLEVNADGAESQIYIYADYVINRKITGIERFETLKKIGEKWKLDLYTKDVNVTAPGVVNHGIAKYYEEMPYIFKCTDINLNITLRSIQKGIPLRCFDIMGCGGFLISNYQEDFLKFFESGKDYVYYDSINDLRDKISYYLANPDKRYDISQNAYNKICKEHTFDIRLEQIIKCSNII